MNSDETWLLYMWSGVFSSVIGGAVAALVATLVLRKTTQHQSMEAVKQMTEQRRVADAEAKKQDARAKEAMARQAHAIEVQLKVQRREAALAREVAVRSELLELTSSFGTLIGQGSAELTRETDRQITVKLHQWMINMMSLDELPLRSELSQWGGLLSDLELVAARGDPGWEGRILLGQALEALQRVATNYRLTWSSDIWNSKYCASLLAVARKNLQDYLLGREEAVDKAFVWGDGQRESDAGQGASNPVPDAQ